MCYKKKHVTSFLPLRKKTNDKNLIQKAVPLAIENVVAFKAAHLQRCSPKVHICTIIHQQLHIRSCPGTSQKRDAFPEIRLICWIQTRMARYYQDDMIFLLQDPYEYLDLPLEAWRVDHFHPSYSSEDFWPQEILVIEHDVDIPTRGDRGLTSIYPKILKKAM